MKPKIACSTHWKATIHPYSLKASQNSTIFLNL
jgi:hypothetical protein